MKKLTNEEFIAKAKKIHGNKYDYSEVEYETGRKKVIINCSKHGGFRQTPHNHLCGKGCLKCGTITASNKEKKTNEQFLIEAKKRHGDRYDYSKTEYKNSKTVVLLTCKIHGDFLQYPFNHSRGAGCPQCKKEKLKKVFTKTTKEFISKAKTIHGNRYDYSKVDYQHARENIVIICKRHGEFKQSANSHLNKNGCPHCMNKNEGKVKELLLQYFKDWNIIPNKKIWDNYKDYNHKRYCDFWLEKDGVKIIVEYDGEQHFKPVRFNGMSFKKAEKLFKKTQMKDELDKQFCEENNIILHRIRYDEDKEVSIQRLGEIICR